MNCPSVQPLHWQQKLQEARKTVYMNLRWNLKTLQLTRQCEEEIKKFWGYCHDSCECTFQRIASLRGLLYAIHSTFVSNPYLNSKNARSIKSAFYRSLPVRSVQDSCLTGILTRSDSATWLYTPIYCFSEWRKSTVPEIPRLRPRVDNYGSRRYYSSEHHSL